MKNLWGMLALQRVLAHRVLIGSRFILLSFTSDLTNPKSTNLICCHEF